MTTYMVLGGGGWLGVQMARHLLACVPEVQVVGVGRSPERPAPFALHRGLDDTRYEYHQIHLAYEPDRILTLLGTKRPSVVVNIAAQGEEAASWSNAWRYFETNTMALARIVEPLIGSSWLGKWVQIGTSSVYGTGRDAASEESPLCPATPYAVSKAAADFYLLSVNHVQRFPMNIIRPSNMYGPGQQLHRIIPKTILCALLGRPLQLQGGGAARKFYLHAEDLARAVRLIAEQAPAGKVYNVGPKQSTLIRTLVEMICRKIGVPFERVVRLAPDRGGQDTQAALDGSLVSAELGWEPRIDLDKGLDDMIAWAKQHLDVLKAQPTEFTFRA